MTLKIARTNECFQKEEGILKGNRMKMQQSVAYQAVNLTSLQQNRKGVPRPLNLERMIPCKCLACLRFETMESVTSHCLRNEVLLPEFEDLCGWYAANIEDFYLELCLLYEICRDDASRFANPGEGYPLEFSFNVRDCSLAIKNPRTCPSPEYVDSIFSCVDKAIESFPEPGTEEYSEEFPKLAKSLIRLLFKVFSIVYSCHYEVLSLLDAAKQLNTTFKRFIFFAVEFDLLELEDSVLRCTVNRLRADFLQRK
eukprot:CAMPEP_0184015744 /NCGR_PEP_ID=MMETSP0954-20121128/6518_1 /TAXON_ID=627963 /ORGANISM="Aplanochytrium sp, Strain PBS07" /LENGTH=253 /DNA_ID=CAMNT_0026296637 /DNA_START=629 /DNA_END=1390 /DNA_ORIENTATION=+